MKRVLVVGGGAAGMMAAYAAARFGRETLLIERNEKLGKKLYITGKGRCNVTNAAGEEEFVENIVRNPRFMRSALARFSSSDLIALLNGAGLRTKVERGGRVFPVSDKSSDVLKTFSRLLDSVGVKVMLNARVSAVGVKGDKRFAVVNGETMLADALIIACGGATYPATGSTGDGYAFAKALGHTVLSVSPALVALASEEAWPGTLAGLTLKNVTLSCASIKRKLTTDIGELLFTHDGISGPLALEMSSRLESAAGALLAIDLKPALTRETLDARVLRDLQANAKKQMRNALEGLLPKRLIPCVLEAAGISPEATELTREKRARLVETLKALPVRIRAPHGFEEAIITRGGVDLRAIDPKTMESKLVPGVYFIGELLDVDGLTGGFNLQIAFSTGYAAGIAAGNADSL